MIHMAHGCLIVAEQGLIKIHTHVTSQGMIFINFDSSPSPVSFDEHFGHLTGEWVGHDFTVYECVELPATEL